MEGRGSVMAKTVDLNCDLGESFGNYKCGMDEKIIPYITSANVACGFHASDPLIMQETVAVAKANHVRVGAHPGFQDLVGFGRRNIALPPNEITAIIEYQIGALNAFCTESQTPLQHVKPHGALYNMAAKDERIADAICCGIAAVNRELILLAPAGSKLIQAAKRYGLASAREIFADRAYEEDGSLVSRKKPGALITDEEAAVRRVVQIIRHGTVAAVTGKEIEMEGDSICVHGDSPGALKLVRSIRDGLIAEGIRIAPLEQVVSENGGHILKCS